MSKTAIKPKKTDPTEAVKKPDSMGEIHRRIDSARDVLVGKVPDPKSQVEQITLALIYKFMGDMDDEAVAMGGKPTFFSDKNADLAWKNLFDPRLGGADMLKLYEKAIESFSLNDKFPELFRNIFKNAYLPYRDPETLKLFLKTINGFQYDHSERLGDAFEYLLSVLGSQGDAGQFRTPRHIIDFIVKVVDPGKDDKILDPACGTAGFLISAFKHVINPHTFEHASKSGDVRKVLRLTTQERAQLMHNIRGYDISPDMVRLSLVNLYLHGFKAPEILEYDTLTSDERWNEYYDVILANPPFMSPKGGIKPHKRFSVQSNRSEVLFVDYIAEHLTPRGRAGIIVPEGIIFQSGNAYKELRKLLVDKFLWAVVSLPAGVFNPYSGVKTSILFLDRARAEKSDSILFVKIQADGFDLGAQRRANAKDDLPAALEILRSVTSAPLSDRKDRSLSGVETSAEQVGDLGLLVPKEKIAASGDYNLSMDRYQPSKQQHSGKWPMVKLGEVCEFVSGFAFKSENLEKQPKNEKYYPVIKIGSFENEGNIVESDLEYHEYSPELEKFLIKEKDILIAMTGATVGKAATAQKGRFLVNQRVGLVRAKNEISQTYLAQFILSPDFYSYCQKTAGGGAQGNISPTFIQEYKLPLPPLEVQCEIVAEIEGCRRVLDGAKQVVESYKPNVEFFLRKYAQGEPWEMVKLGELTKIENGIVLTEFAVGGKIACIKVSDMNLEENQYHIVTSSHWMEETDRPFLPENSIVFPKRGAAIGTNKKRLTKIPCLIDNNCMGLTVHDKEMLLPEFLFQFLLSFDLSSISNSAGIALINNGDISGVFLPLPPLAIQQAIVADIEQERALVESNRQLAQLMQAKIKAVVERVWVG